MMRRGIVLGVALATLSVVPAHASTTSMSYTTTTSVAGTPLPASTVTADGVAVGKGKETGERTMSLHLSGSNLPAAESVVTAVWRGTVRAGRDGAAVGIGIDSAHAPFPGSAGTDVTVERQVRGGWVTCYPESVMAIRAVELTEKGTKEHFSASCRGVRRGAAVPVRVTFVVTYDETVASIDDTISVAAVVA